MTKYDPKFNPQGNPFDSTNGNVLRVARYLIRDPEAWTCDYLFASQDGHESNSYKEHETTVTSWCMLGALVEASFVLGLISKTQLDQYDYTHESVLIASSSIAKTIRELFEGVRLEQNDDSQVYKFNDHESVGHDQVIEVLDETIRSVVGVGCGIALSKTELAWVEAVRASTVTPVVVDDITEW